MTDYKYLRAALESLISGVPHRISNLANSAALIFDNMADLNWAGFYILEDGKLVLGPFQGKTACIEIEIGRGVCGLAAKNDETVVVPDVHAFPGHIACDSASNSEIVIPIHKDGKLFGVLDIDSPKFSRFNEDDKAGLEALAKIIGKNI